jgi:HJR/Mrr/RecB family endonuclease
MKTQQTSAYAHDLLAEIRAVLEGAEAGVEANFADQLTQILADAALLQMREGLMNERKFEKLVALMLERLGATTTITPRSRDVGDDVVATFKAIGITVVAQVKYHKSPQWETGPEAVDQVLSGIDKVSADVGWVVTCGRFSELARDRAKNPPGGKRVRLIEGDEFAKMLVAAGIDHIGGTLGATSAS